MARRMFRGNTVPTTLLSPITNSALAFTVAASGGSTYPDGSTGNFVVTLDYGAASGEEKVLCSARSGDSFTVASRGYDGTAAAAHSAGAGVRHTISAVDLDEANAHVNSTTSVHGIADTSLLLTTAAGNAAYAPLSGSTNYVSPTLVDAKGDLLVGTADNTLARKAVGSDGQVLTADAASAGGVKWAAAVSATSTYNPAFLGHVAALAVSGTPGGVGTANLAEYVRIRPLANVSITTIRAYIGSGLTAEVGIYSSTGTGSAARPNAKLVSATTPSGSGGWLDATVSSTALTAGTDYWLGITSSSVNGYFAVTPSVMDTNEVCKEAGASSLPATATGASPISVPLIKVLV